MHQHPSDKLHSLAHELPHLFGFSLRTAQCARVCHHQHVKLGFWLLLDIKEGMSTAYHPESHIQIVSTPRRHPTYALQGRSAVQAKTVNVQPRQSVLSLLHMSLSYALQQGASLG